MSKGDWFFNFLKLKKVDGWDLGSDNLMFL